jgi:hypothetical protein
VLLHGQPGSAADWLQVAGRLPAELHAVAADRPGYGSSQLPAHPALAHVPDRAMRPAARTGRAGAGHPVRPAAGAPARRPSGRPGSRRYRPTARPRSAGRSLAARARRRSSPAQARSGYRRRCHSGVPGSGGRSRQPRMRRIASPSGTGRVNASLSTPIATPPTDHRGTSSEGELRTEAPTARPSNHRSREHPMRRPWMARAAAPASCWYKTAGQSREVRLGRRVHPEGTGLGDEPTQDRIALGQDVSGRLVAVGPAGGYCRTGHVGPPCLGPFKPLPTGPRATMRRG